MQVGDTEYRTTLRRWANLFDTHPRTFEQEVEFDALHRKLDAAERESVIQQVTSDYDQLRHIGDLSGAEL